MVYPKVIYRNGLGKHSWCRYIHSRIYVKNENALIGITGQTGSGKTYFGMSFAEILRDDFGFIFDIDHIVFSFLDLMKLINRNDLKRGTVILFDEPQTEINSKNHQSEINKVFYQLTSTFRHRGFVLLFCNPFLEDLDKSTRKLFHANFIMQSKDTKARTAKVKPYYLEWSSQKDDWYRHFLKVVHKPAGKSKFVSQPLKSWAIPHPSMELCNDYEIKKRQFTDALNKRIQEKLEALENKDKPQTINPIDRLTDKQIGAIEAMISHSNQYEASDSLGISQAALSFHLKAAQKKGVSIKNYSKYREMEEISQNKVL